MTNPGMATTGQATGKARGIRTKLIVTATTSLMNAGAGLNGLRDITATWESTAPQTIVRGTALPRRTGLH